jgi:hypothetical protein
MIAPLHEFDEEFLGFDLEHIEAAEGKYLQQLNVLQQLDLDIKFPI